MLIQTGTDSAKRIFTFAFILLFLSIKDLFALPGEIWFLSGDGTVLWKIPSLFQL
jgi:hypothetical protein